MKCKGILLGFTSLVASSCVIAGAMGEESIKGFRPVVSVFGGAAGLQVDTDNSRTFTDTNTDDSFLYISRKNSGTSWLAGAFLGVEHQLPMNGLFLQAGLEYDYFGRGTTSGLNAVGVDYGSSTWYNYSWRVQTQQVLAVAKLFTTANIHALTHRIFYPYASVGLGAAFNDASGFRIATPQTQGLNVAPTFHNNNNSAFSYSLGLGVDTDINEHFRFGLGYRFSDFGKASLGSGAVVFNQEVSPIGFTLSAGHTYANQFIAQISYLA